MQFRAEWFRSSARDERLLQTRHLKIDTPVLRALAANTSIKMAARLEGTDPATMARDMNTSPEFIRDQPVGAFATFIRGWTPSAMSMRFPINALSRFDVMSTEEREIVRQMNRAAYANTEDGAQEARTSGETADATAPPRWRRDPDAS